MYPFERIYPRLALSFGTVVVIALLSAALLFFSLVSRSGEERLTRDMERAAEVISDFGSSLSEGLVHRLGKVLGSEVAIIAPTSLVVSSSLPSDQWQELKEQLTDHLHPANDGEAGTFSVALPGGRFTTLVRPLRATGGGAPHWLALLRPTAAEQAWKHRIAIKIAWITAGAIALVALLGHQLARRITRPIQELSTIATDFAAGDRSRRVASIGSGEIRSLAEAFNTMADHLQETEERRVRAERQAVAGRLAAAVAHEVRNPLSSVQMLVQMIRDRLSRSEGLEAEAGYARLVLDEIQRVEIVLQGLLDLARPRPLDRRSTDVEALVDEVVALTRSHLEHRQVTLHRASEGVPYLLEVDPDRMKQVVLNLVLNGADAMADGGELRVSTHWRSADERMEIRVEDQGDGIDPDRAESLFEPFQSNRNGGVGIGLAISRQIARDHGGDLSLTPLPRGTRATAWFPARSSE